MLTVATLARAIAAGLTDALAPPACAACDERLNHRAVLCPSCADAVLPAGRGMGHPPEGRPALRPWVPIVGYALFGGPIAVALRRFKYADRPDLSGPLGHLLRRAVRDTGLCADVVIPVPLHPARLAERGYNQAALLASAAAPELAAPLDTRALRRVRHTPQQARLARARRLDNVAGAFHVRAPERVGGRRVVLVDDVATTGATLAACGDALRQAGAASVTALVVARVEREGEDE